ncbi:unnamed protein product [Calypogeia fissa]
MGKTVADTIGDIEIEKVQGPIEAKSIQIKSLWENQGVVIHFLRRFGCQLCRGHALELEQIVPTLEANGFRVVAIGVERFGVEDFQAGKFWKGELYIDDGKKALKALDVKQLSIFNALKDIALNKDVSTAFKKTKDVPHNYKGDGRQLGATFVFAKGGKILLDHRQKNFGDHASNEAILKAAAVDPTTIAAEAKEATEPAAECDMICS